LRSDKLTVATSVPQSLTRAYEHHPDGNIRTMTVEDHLSDGVLQKLFTYGYDGLNRLASARTTDGRPPRLSKLPNLNLFYTTDLSYPPAGNIAVATVLGAQGLPSRTGVQYTYDSSGATGDPQALRGLVDSSGNNIAELAYDRTGNLGER